MLWPHLSLHLAKKIGAGKRDGGLRICPHLPRLAGEPEHFSLRLAPAEIHYSKFLSVLPLTSWLFDKEESTPALCDT